MTYVPAVPLGGVGGLRFLERTDVAQRAAHARSPEIQRNIAYFAENIANIRTADELVANRQLLTVVLGAYGLEGEVDKRAFIARILEGGVEDQNSLANRLNDQRFRDMVSDFRFDRVGFPLTGSPTLRDKTISGYLEQSYETSVGEQDNALRLALYFKRRGAEVAERGWFAMIGDRPTRAVLQTALGLPSDIAGIDIDKQKELFEDRTQRLFGTRDPAALASPEIADRVISRYLALDQAARGPSATTPGYAALTLLQAASGFGPAASISLFTASFGS